jgi:hypothetical protein
VQHASNALYLLSLDVCLDWVADLELRMDKPLRTGVLTGWLEFLGTLFKAIFVDLNVCVHRYHKLLAAKGPRENLLLNRILMRRLSQNFMSHFRNRTFFLKVG